MVRLATLAHKRIPDCARTARGLAPQTRDKTLIYVMAQSGFAPDAGRCFQFFGDKLRSAANYSDRVFWRSAFIIMLSALRMDYPPESMDQWSMEMKIFFMVNQNVGFSGDEFDEDAVGYADVDFLPQAIAAARQTAAEMVRDDDTWRQYDDGLYSEAALETFLNRASDVTGIDWRDVDGIESHCRRARAWDALREAVRARPVCIYRMRLSEERAHRPDGPVATFNHAAATGNAEMMSLARHTLELELALRLVARRIGTVAVKAILSDREVPSSRNIAEKRRGH